MQKANLLPNGRTDWLFLCLTRASFVFIPRPVVKHHRSVCRHLHLKNPCICNIFFRHFRITLSGRKHQALKSRCFFPAYTGFPGCYPYVSLLILIIKDHYDLFRIRKNDHSSGLMIVPQKFQGTFARIGYALCMQIMRL